MCQATGGFRPSQSLLGRGPSQSHTPTLCEAMDLLKALKASGGPARRVLEALFQAGVYTQEQYDVLLKKLEEIND